MIKFNLSFGLLENNACLPYISRHTLRTQCHLLVLNPHLFVLLFFRSCFIIILLLLKYYSIVAFTFSSSFYSIWSFSTIVMLKNSNITSISYYCVPRCYSTHHTSQLEGPLSNQTLLAIKCLHVLSTLLKNY